MAPSLPDGWARTLDPETQLPYYHNAALGVTQWEPPGAPAGSAKVMSAMAAKKIEEEYGRSSGAGATDDAANAAAAGTPQVVMHPVVKAGAGAFLQARAASGVSGAGSGGGFQQPPQQQQHAQRRTTTLSAGPMRKRDHDAAGMAVPVAGDADLHHHHHRRDAPATVTSGAGEIPEAPSGGKRRRGDESEAGAGSAATAAAGAGAGAGGRRGEAAPPPLAAAIAAAAAASAPATGTAWERPAPPPMGRPLDCTGPPVRVPSPPRTHRGDLEETGDAGAAANIGPMAKPRHASAELPEWRRKALEQDKVKAGEWSNAAATAGKTGYGPAFGGHVEGAKMDAVRGTAAYLEAMTGKSVSVMRIDRKRESHGMQTDGRALF